MDINATLSTITIISAALMVVMILLQSRGATLGAGFGSSGELFTTRRGLEKNLYETTIVIAVIFVLSIVIGLILG
jgi:preprotein translocase subunit SecG